MFNLKLIVYRNKDEKTVLTDSHVKQVLGEPQLPCMIATPGGKPRIAHQFVLPHLHAMDRIAHIQWLFVFVVVIVA